MKKLFYLLFFVSFSAMAQYTPSTNVNYVKFAKIPPVGTASDSVLTIGSDGFMKRVLRSAFRQNLNQTLQVGNTTDLQAVFQDGTYTNTIDAFGSTVFNSAAGETGTFNENTLQFANSTGAYFGLDGVNRQIQWVNSGTGQSVEIKADSVTTGYTSQMPKLSAGTYFPGYLLKVNANDSIPANSFGTIDMTHTPLVLTDGTNTTGFYIDQVILSSPSNTNILDPGGFTVQSNTNTDKVTIGVSDTDALIMVGDGSSDERLELRKEMLTFRNEISSANGSQTIEPPASITGAQRFFLPNPGAGNYTLATEEDLGGYVKNPMDSNLDANGNQINNVDILSTVDVVATNNIEARTLILDGEASPSYERGRLTYDNSNESLTFYNNDSNVALQIGQEEWIRVKNVSGSTIADGSAVYINGSNSGLPTIALAQANSATTTVCVGLATESIANNAIGYVTAMGLARDLNTSSFSTGAVYLSDTTPGALTQTVPSAPNYRYRVGFVTNVNSTTGTIHVTPSTASLANGTSGQVVRINGSGIQEYYTPRVGHVEFKGAAIASPADATTYYLSQTNNVPPSSTSGRTISAPITATYVNWSLNSTTGGGASAEGATVQLKNITTGAAAVTLTTGFTSNAASTSTNTLSGTTSFSCTQGDKIECTLVTPTWATNPTNLILNFFMTFQN